MRRTVAGMTRPIGRDVVGPDTRQRLLEAGLALLLERGYNGTGVQHVLAATGVPKGSFYHHFESKETFALEVIDLYMAAVHAQWDEVLADTTCPPLVRIRRFFEATRAHYAEQGYLGCLLGGLGQELSGANDLFRRRIERCMAAVAGRVATCLREAQARGELAASVDPQQMADILVDCWEGAALRSRLVRNAAPLNAVLDFYFRAAEPVR